MNDDPVDLVGSILAVVCMGLAVTGNVVAAIALSAAGVSLVGIRWLVRRWTSMKRATTFERWSAVVVCVIVGACWIAGCVSLLDPGMRDNRAMGPE